MPRNPRTELPYDPIRADLVRQVTSLIRRSPDAPAPRRTLTPAPPKPEPVAEPTITKRFVLTRTEDAELNAFLLRLQTASGCKVPLSVVVRAALAILMENEDRIAGAAERIRPQLPSTHDRLALGQFEEQWRFCLIQASHQGGCAQATTRAGGVGQSAGSTVHSMAASLGHRPPPTPGNKHFSRPRPPLPASPEGAELFAGFREARAG